MLLHTSKKIVAFSSCHVWTSKYTIEVLMHLEKFFVLRGYARQKQRRKKKMDLKHDALRRVPLDVWDDIYKFQRPEDVVKFALSSPRNYKKVLADFQRYVKRCKAGTGNWQAQYCLTQPVCIQSCLEEPNFMEFVVSLPRLVGMSLRYTTVGPSSNQRSEEQTTVIARVVLTAGWDGDRLETPFDEKRFSLLTLARGMEQGTHRNPLADSRLRERILRFHDAYPLKIILETNPVPNVVTGSHSTNLLLGAQNLGRWNLYMSDPDSREPYTGFEKNLSIWGKDPKPDLSLFPTQGIPKVQMTETFATQTLPEESDIVEDPRGVSPPFIHKGFVQARVPSDFKNRKTLLRKRLRSAQSDREREILRQAIKLGLLERGTRSSMDDLD